MNKRQKEIQQVYLDEEKRLLGELEESYEDALAEINAKLEALQARQDADMEHVIYQVEYQRQLKTQVQAILETLQTNEFESLSQYLTKAYENGFYGAMYDMHGQGVPLIFPIDQAQVVDAIKHETKLSASLYTELGYDIKDLQRKIAGEISRGISQGRSYNQIALSISMWAKIPENRAMTIARTEAHRIQCRATFDAQHKARAKGADVVKQWNSALDGNTRPNHRKLDGQIRELDDPFEVGGMKAMYPGDFGLPGEDCNCRCALLQRARWALGAEELETLKQRAEIMGEYDSYNEFRDSYEKALNELFQNEENNLLSMNLQFFATSDKDQINELISRGEIDEQVFNEMYRYFNNSFSEGIETPIGRVYNTKDSFWHIAYRHREMMATESIDRIIEGLQNPNEIIKTTDRFGNEGICYVLEEEGREPLIIIERNGIITSYIPSKNYLAKQREEGEVIWKN